MAAAGQADEHEYQANVGWLYIPYYSRSRNARLPEQTPEPNQEKPPGVGPADTDLIIEGWGTGFMIHPHYILTNRHVVQDSDGLLVAASGEVRRDSAPTS